MATPRAFPIRPNWRENFAINYEFDTEVIVSKDGTEQRRGWRDTPRKSVEFMVSGITPSRFTSLKGFMASTQGQIILTPEVTRGVRSIGPSALFAYTMATDPATPSWLVAGATVVLIDGEHVEGRTVDSVAAGTITFEEMNTTPWSDYTLISPGLPSRVNPAQSSSQVARGVTEGTFSFTVDPCSEFEEFDETPEAVWNNREVFIRRCNWAAAQDLNFAHPTEMVDYGYGVVSSFQPVKFGTELRSADFLAVTPDDVTDALAFFRRQRGRLREFYVPTDEPDIELRGTANNGATAIPVEGGAEMITNYNESLVFRAISVKMTDGRRFYREVVSVTLHATLGVRIVLAVGLPYALTPETVEVISWLPVSRFASDTLTVAWVTNGVAQIRFNYTTIKAETPDDL